jgi:hypothetical protein
MFSRQISWQLPFHLPGHLILCSMGLSEPLELRRSASRRLLRPQGRCSCHSGSSPRLRTGIARFHLRQEPGGSSYRLNLLPWFHNPIHSIGSRESRTNFAEEPLVLVKTPRSTFHGCQRESVHTRRNRKGHIPACRSARRCRSPRYTPSADSRDRQSAYKAQAKQAILRGAWSKSRFRRCNCLRAADANPGPPTIVLSRIAHFQ